MTAVHLVGGGRDESAVLPLFAAFVQDAGADLAARPRIHVLLVLEPDDAESVDRFAGALRLAGADAVVHAIVEGEMFAPTALAGADGVFIGGGLTPAYHAAMVRIAPILRERVATGMPYLGFSAGAAIAAERALIGGFRLGGVLVCDEDAGEELDELGVVAGLGLVPFSVEVHAAQWGTLSRLVAAVDAGLIASGFAIDEHTAVIWRGARDAGDVTIAGAGAAWHVERDAGSPTSPVGVTRRTDGQPRGGTSSIE